MKPTFDNIFVTEIDRPTTTASGIVLTGAVESGNKPAKVLAIGPDVDLVVEGMTVYTKWADAVAVTHDGVKGAIIKQSNILAFI